MANKTIKNTFKILDNDFEEPFKKLKLLNLSAQYPKSMKESIDADIMYRS